jgi:hypothetical protein
MELTPEQIDQIAEASSNKTIQKLLTKPTLWAMAKGIFSADDILVALPDEPNPANKYVTFVTWARKIGEALIPKKK